MFTQFLRIITTAWTRQLSLLVAASNKKRPRCDRAWTSCLGVSFVLKESQLLAERSRNHTDRPMDGASVSQGRVLQCSFHPLFPSLSRNQPAASLVTLRDTLLSRFSSLSLFFSFSLSLSYTRLSPPRARTSILRDSPSMPRLFSLRFRTPFSSSNVTSRTINFCAAPTHPVLASSLPPFSRPFDWSQLLTTKGWSINHSPR